MNDNGPVQTDNPEVKATLPACLQTQGKGASLPPEPGNNRGVPAAHSGEPFVLVMGTCFCH